jgi:hypothetical protein
MEPASRLGVSEFPLSTIHLEAGGPSDIPCFSAVQQNHGKTIGLLKYHTREEDDLYVNLWMQIRCDWIQYLRFLQKELIDAKLGRILSGCYFGGRLQRLEF